MIKITRGGGALVAHEAVTAMTDKTTMDLNRVIQISSGLHS
jgi:hypothetical protein